MVNPSQVDHMLGKEYSKSYLQNYIFFVGIVDMWPDVVDIGMWNEEVVNNCIKLVDYNFSLLFISTSA